MKISYLKNIINIKKRVFKTDDIGNRIDNEYTQAYKTYAYANSISGDELWKSFQIFKSNVVVFEMRYNKFFEQLNTKDYVIEWKGQLYNIIQLDNVQFQNKIFKIRGELING